MTVGERIQTARKKAGMKQSELAEKLGVAVITIGQYERNKRQPRIEQLRAIADALEVPLFYFTGEITDFGEAKEYWRETKSYELLSKSVYGIIEALYGKRGSRIAQGRWSSEVIDIFGDNADAITINGEDMDVITDAIKALTISLVENFKLSAEDEVKRLREELSSDSFRDSLRGNPLLAHLMASPESTLPDREGDDTTQPSDAPMTPPESL